VYGASLLPEARPFGMSHSAPPIRLGRAPLSSTILRSPGPEGAFEKMRCRKGHVHPGYAPVARASGSNALL